MMTGLCMMGSSYPPTAAAVINPTVILIGIRRITLKLRFGEPDENRLNQGPGIVGGRAGKVVNELIAELLNEACWYRSL